MIRNFISKLYSLYTPSFFMSGGGSAAGGYVIERSLRCNAASSQYLSRTPTAGNRTAWTVSLWIKRGKLGTRQDLFGVNNSNGLVLDISGGTDKLQFQVYNGAGADYYILTSNALRDPSAWYHIVAVWDSNNATAADRLRLYINGSRASGTTGNTIPLGALSTLNSATELNFCRNPQGGFYFEGYIADPRFIDGQALDASSFGEISTATGQWVAKRYIGAYGTNGSYPDFKDGTSTTTLGDDKSGNNNDWTLTNFTRSAGVNDCWMLDVPAGNGSASAVQPSGNYCVLNPLHKSSGMSTTNANLTAVSSSTSQVLGSTFAVNSGKWYWETHIVANNSEVIGVIDLDDVIASTAYPGATVKSYGVYPFSGTKYNNGSGTAYTAAYAAGVVGVKLDMDAGTISFTKLGVDQGVAFSSLTGYKMPACGDLSAGADFSMAHNFGQREFTYSVPAGYKALCTANLPVPGIKKPSDHFKVQLSTGANIKTDAEALFTNELEWIKDRANANNHQLIDSVRGSNAVLQSNTTAAETTYSAPSGSSVGWVWRASDSAAVTNTNGSISSQVSANVSAGFSVVSYDNHTGTISTVGHGLGVAPAMIISKARNTGAQPSLWFTYHKSVGATAFLDLATSATPVANATFMNNVAPTSTVFTLGSGRTQSNYGAPQIAYCFAEIDGYSKFGSYTGNGSADGPFVYTGFRPKYILIKRIDAANTWFILDASRDGYNPSSLNLYPNLTNAETAEQVVDLVSNGFKVRQSFNNQNASGGTYIYMAFAESPFQYANAR